jgi:tetratricopeptide (TPR) repeat protein
MSATNENELDPKQLNLWKKALLANEQRNWEYVTSLALPVVQANPLFLEARMLLRRAEGETVKGQKKGLFGGGMSISFKGTSKKDPWEAIADLEENVFQKDPFNIRANQEFYDLAMRAGHRDLAAFALETIRLGHPTVTKHAHTLADHYMAEDQPDKAGEIFSAILKVDPKDMVAVKGEKDAAARNSIRTGGWNTGGGPTPAKGDGDKERLERGNKQGMTPEQMEAYLQDLYADHQADTTNINHVRSIAELLEKMENLDSAMEWYSYALDLNPADVALVRKKELLQDTINEKAIERLQQDIDADPNAPDIEERKAELAEIKRQRGAKAIEEAKARVERNPADKAFHFDLGQAYFNAGMYGEAIPELQQGRQNPSLRIKALLMLGRCFERKNMNDLAINTLADCVKELQVMDATKKESLYELGMVYEKVGKTTEYLECLKEIYNNDYGFRDVAKRVESSYQ